MTVTSAGANKLLRRLNDEKEGFKSQEHDGYKFTAATIENVEDARPEYDFISLRKAIDECNEKIRKVKHAINVFNSTTVLEEFGMTVDEVLVCLPQISEELDMLETMARMPAKKRDDGYGKSNDLIEYTYANFDTKEAKNYYYRMYALRQKLQTALDVLNNTVTFEIDL